LFFYFLLSGTQDANNKANHSGSEENGKPYRRDDMSKNKNSKVEDTFAAVAFAEAGEHETAAKMAGVTDRPKRLLDKFLRVWESHMAAVAFAEAGEHDEALKWIGDEKLHAARKDTLNDFLEKIGLENTRVCYGVMPLRTE
jgi:hypothetical protein